ncbi:hypothetical protein [Streptomyces sp. IBSBF 2435]|uniref:hypothetical protein n=1 Tax=Streptomyces sp. IBSBF 2435 TaxID=2903531 RepID=UPI002FDC6E31
MPEQSPASADAAPAGKTAVQAHDEPLAFHPLTFQPEGGEVTVGRMDEGTFVVLPADGAALLRRLVEGTPPRQAARWYEQEYGDPVDIDDFAAELTELGFLRADGIPEPLPARPLRWRQLGRAVFSPVGAVLYTALLAACVLVVVHVPDAAPRYHNVFFTHYMSVLTLTLFVGQLPLILLHESAHALAGRRLGVPSRLSIGRRLYYVVFETNLDGLAGVPRRSRYLPMLAGMLTDVGCFAVLTLLAAATHRAGGGFPPAGAVLLALAYATLLRLVWQGYFFLQTDIYYLVVTVLGCVDLQTTARQLLANRWCAVLRRPAPYDPEQWHPRDHAVARWYSWLMVVGYAFCLATLLLTLLPILVHVFGTAVARLAGNGHQGGAGLADSLLFLVLSLGETAVAVTMYVRGRRGTAPTAETAAPASA